MKTAIVAIAIAVATLALSSVSFAQSNCSTCQIFAATNDDNPATGANTATVFGYPAPGGVIGISQTLHTGGTGIGSGYFAVPRIATAYTDKCLIVSDPAGSPSFPNGDIAGFGGNPGFYAVTPTTQVASGDTAPSIYGIGLAVTPNGKFLFASLDNSESIETLSITPSPCKLTPMWNFPNVGDNIGPMTVSSDGKALIVTGPNNSFVNAYRIAPNNGILVLINPFGTICATTGLPCSIDLTSTAHSNCPTVGVGCFPTGIDISKVNASGNATVVMGNATLAGPYYITCSLNTLTGLSACNTQPITGPGALLANIENPFYNKAGYLGTTTAGIYFSAAGFGTGYPAGVSLNPVGAGGAVTAASTAAYVNPAAFYASNAQPVTMGANQYVWQSGVTGSLVNTMYLYRWNGAIFVGGPWPRSLANPNANGTSYVLSLQAMTQFGQQAR